MGQASSLLNCVWDTAPRVSKATADGLPQNRIAYGSIVGTPSGSPSLPIEGRISKVVRVVWGVPYHPP